MTQAFDLEQDILKCWNITDDIGEIATDLEDGHMEITQAAQALRAYQQVYQRRFEKCFKRFEDYNQEAWAWKHRLQALEKDLDESKNPTASKGKMAKSKEQKEVDH